MVTDEMIDAFNRAYSVVWEASTPVTTQGELVSVERKAVRAGIEAAQPTDLRQLIVDLTDEDPCEFDHHGYCQAHGWMAREPRCPHARAKELLGAAQYRN